MLRRIATLVLVATLGLAACSSTRLGTGGESPASMVLLWENLDEAFTALSPQDLPCAEPFGTWFTDFGMRGLACAGAEAAGTSLFLEQAPPVFQSGPHEATAEGMVLDLDAPRDFGRYSPDFVEWAVTHGVVGEEQPLVRQALQGTYDAHVRRLARIYWLTHADLAVSGFPEGTPPGPLSDYAAFLDGGPVPSGAEGYDSEGNRNGGFSVFVFSERSEALIPGLGLPVMNDWTVKYEGNTAYGFWLRRRADGTHAQWHAGLRRLLATYDATWLAAQS